MVEIWKSKLRFWKISTGGLCFVFLPLFIFGSPVDARGCFSCTETTCRRIVGLFSRPVLPLGYNLIARLPTSACNITVNEVTPSKNFLALRTSEGYIINGNWNVVPSGRYMGAGTGFFYSHSRRGDGESIFAPGPLVTYVDIMVIYQSSAVNIQYEFWQPGSESGDGVTSPVSFLARSKDTMSSQTHNIRPVLGNRINTVLPRQGHSRRSQKYSPQNQGYLENVQSSFVALPSQTKGNTVFPKAASWTVWKFTPCSRSCGGGTQETVYICTNGEGQILEDFHCGTTRPLPQTVACNTKQCPPRWTFSEWSQCSASCGTGQMTRTLTCLQEMGNSRTRVLPNSACPSTAQLHSVNTVQLCNIAPCTRWRVGSWGKCSVECGTGIRVRDVQCQAEEIPVSSNQCNEHEKPFQEELCHAHICAKHTWFFTQWTEECVGGCENGVHVRRVWCSPGVNSIEAKCSRTDIPPTTKPCTNSQACGAAWFTGQWSPCTSQCGNGTRNREVVCVVHLRGSFRATFDNECDPDRRPEASSVCNTEPCPPHWYSTDWTECSRRCGRGSQRRAVQCLDSAQLPSLSCVIEERPKTTRPCNTHPCNESKFGNCIDRFQNCLMVQRARLCKYSYYQSICCASCRSSPL